MSKIVHLQKTLITRSVPEAVTGVTIRGFIGLDDIEGWLALRDATFAHLVAAGRRWMVADFQREFAASRLWAAVVERDATSVIVGSVALGRTGRPPQDRAALQWLMAAPNYRRRGVGRALISVVEQTVWDDGEREILVETHADWRDAMRLYERCGYAAIR
jgi:GNAT superfamily N-acetyltransferase